MNNSYKKCPVCENSFDNFCSLGGRYLNGVEINGKHFSVDKWETLNIKEYACPACGANDRSRLYYLFLKDEINRLYEIKNEKINMIHFAPEQGKFRELLKNNSKINYRTADLFMPGVDDKIDLMSMPEYSDEQFDLILCSHVLEHVADDRAAIKEISRILKKGGTAVLMVPVLLGLDENYENDSVKTFEERWKHFGQDDHVRVYSKAGFSELIQKDGNLVLLEFGVDYFSKENFNQYGIDPKSNLYAAKKK